MSRPGGHFNTTPAPRPDPSTGRLGPGGSTLTTLYRGEDQRSVAARIKRFSGCWWSLLEMWGGGGREVLNNGGEAGERETNLCVTCVSKGWSPWRWRMSWWHAMEGGAATKRDHMSARVWLWGTSAETCQYFISHNGDAPRGSFTSPPWMNLT